MNNTEKEWCDPKTIFEVRDTDNRNKELRWIIGRNKYLLIGKERKFTSIVPSVNTIPLLVTVNHPAADNGYERGIIMPLGNKFIDAESGYDFDTILPLTKDYDYIDGVDGGLVRVYQKKESVKKWGLLALLRTDTGYEFKGVVIDSNGGISFSENQDDYLVYDNLWNFYDKKKNHIPAEKDDEIIDISLDKIKEHMNNPSVHNDNADKNKHVQNQTENENLSNLEEAIVQNQAENVIVSYLEEVTVQNFKRFAERTSLEDLSANFTFIVGKNNAGKSTLLSAIDLCCQYNLKRLNFDTEGNFYFAFPFKDNSPEDYVNRSSTDKVFMLSITSGGWRFEFKIEGSKGKAIVHEFSVSNTRNFESIVFKREEVKIVFEDKPEERYTCSKHSWIIDSKNDEEHPNQYLTSDDLYDKDSRLSGVEVLLKPLLEETQIAEKMGEIYTSIDNALDPCKGTSMIPVFAPIVPHEGKVDEEDKDFVSSAVTEYAKIDKDYHAFVCKWLKRMEMGHDFNVKKNGKEYIVTITQQDGGSCNLSKMGSGTIHFVILCFKILSFIDKYKNNRYVPTLLIMEPEQNLHPMLQSHMVNFLMDISDLYSDSFQDPKERRHLKIIVETHSEYMIRRSQVIAKRFADRGKEIPFRTYYFPSEGKPKDMGYRKDGRFKEEFGPGFTDESTMLSFQLI